jgi:hypothetical protein
MVTFHLTHIIRDIQIKNGSFRPVGSNDLVQGNPQTLRQ